MRRKHRAALDRQGSDAERLDRLCELNVIEQAAPLASVVAGHALNLYLRL